jgi:serine/threonine protein kinase
MPVDPAAAKSLFLEAAAIEDAIARAALVIDRCGENRELLARVNALLAANDRALAIAEMPKNRSDHGQAEELTSDYSNRDEQPGAVIAGKYTLVEVIGEGGMGSVWRAKQSEPVKRYVAVKLIKAGMDSKQVLARFEAERQALALMDHPSIAKVLDGGLHERRPFFVMELVKGVPITKYCDAQRLTPKERLELFVPVCQAIQHAHQKGIIHRDIKPSNVLVALYDDKPVVKVIDFGVAKATGGTLTEATIDTGFGGVVGTPEYMSPEQATFNNLDIDTRTDVYALGALLYELLTGSPPFSRNELEQRGLLEILRVVREEEPPRPSTKLSTANALPSISANRGTEPKKLTGLLRNELDWIVMKALEKDRTRRYETANGFAADVLRYLSGEAVQAHPPSAAYRLKKFVRRNRVAVFTTTLIAASIAVVLINYMLGLMEIRRERDRAVAAEQAALAAATAEKEAKIQAQKNFEQAKANLAFAKKGNEILGSVFAGLDPKKIAESGRPLQDVLRENLGNAVKELEGSAIGEPLEVAKIQHTLGMSLLGLGEYSQAIEVIGKSLETRKSLIGPEDDDTLESMNALALAYDAGGKLEKALPLFEQSYELMKAKYGPKAPRTLTSMHNLACVYVTGGKLNLALPMFEENLKLRKATLGTDHPDTLASMSSLAVAYHDGGRFDKAVSLCEEVVDLAKIKQGDNHPDTLTSMNNLAAAYKDAGMRDKALPLYQKTLKQLQETLGAAHPNTLLTMINLAQVYQAAGRLDLALSLCQEAFRLSKARLGVDHPSTLTSMSSLASAYESGGKLELALPLYEEAFALSKTKLGAEHPTTLTAMNNLALAYEGRGKLDLALPLFQECLRLRKATRGPDHPETLASMHNLAAAFISAGKPDLALPLSEECLQLRTAKMGANHPDTLLSMNNLAGFYWLSRRLDKSVPLFEEVLRRAEKKLGRDDLFTQKMVANLGVNYRDSGRLAEALPLLEEASRSSSKYPALSWVRPQLLNGYVRAGKDKAAEFAAELIAEDRKRLSDNSAQLAAALANYSRALLEVKAYTQAESLLRECLATREKTQPDTWQTFNTQSMLGGALLGQKKYVEAEPLLLKGYEGMKQNEKTVPPQARGRIPEALDRLIDIYTAMNKPEEVKKWQAEKEAFKAKAEPTQSTKP